MDQTHSEIKIRVISVWFGKLPSYILYFLKTCSANKTIDWLLMTDQEYLYKPSQNVTFFPSSKRTFEKVVARKLGFNIIINNPYKICDFKPLFGLIFEDHLKGYQYWGYCDLDMIFGDIQQYIYPLIYEKPDILSFYHNFLSGPFCLYKNRNNINELFRNCPDFQSILQNPEHKAFDEHIPRKIIIVRKLLYQLLYLLKLVFIGPRFKLWIPEIRYQFQWYFKKINSLYFPPSDMTDVVHIASSRNNINAMFQDSLRSDRAFRRQGHKKWKLSWQNGKLHIILLIQSLILNF